MILRRESRWLLAWGSMLLAGVVSASCATVHERHFFRQHVSDSEVNYFRITVRGWASGSQLRYVSGYFDEKAVEEYFGEFSQPNNGSFSGEPAEPAPSGGTPPGDATTPAGPSEGTSAQADQVEPIDPKLAGRRLVMLLSANSDAIAGQIGAIAENEDVMESVGKLLNRDEVVAEREARAQSEMQERFGTRIVESARATAGRWTPTTTEQAAQADLLAVGNELAALLGATERFTDLPSLRAWLNKNRQSIMREVGL